MKKIIFLLCTLFLFFFVLEVVTRIAIRIYLHFEYGPELARFQEMDLEADKKKGWHWRGDQLFRGRSEVPNAKPDGLYRIITTGDSCCWGALVPPDATFSAKLDLLLKKRFGNDRAEVLNAGVVGYNSLQVRQHFLQALADYKPDLLIYYGTGEDSALWIRGKKSAPKSTELGIVHRMLFKSRFFRLLSSGVSKIRPQPPAADTWLEQSDNLHLLQKTVEERGTKLMLVEYLGVVDGKISSHIAGIGLDFQVPVVRTYETFMTSGRPVRELIFDQVHPTAAGHSIIARLIFDEIVSLGLIDDQGK